MAGVYLVVVSVRKGKDCVRVRVTAIFSVRIRVTVTHSCTICSQCSQFQGWIYVQVRPRCSKG